MIARFLFLLALAPVTAAQAQVAPDLTPVVCAWNSFTPERQAQLRNAFVADSSGQDRVLSHNNPGAQETQAAARACGLNYSPTQIADLSGALGYKATDEMARMGIANRGLLKPEIVDRAVAKLSDERRATIGDRLACPGTATLQIQWDDSLISAMRRTGIRIVDGRTVALIAIAMYAVVAEEGFMRRIAGTAPACAPPD